MVTFVSQQPVLSLTRRPANVCALLLGFPASGSLSSVNVPPLEITRFWVFDCSKQKIEEDRLQVVWGHLLLHTSPGG